MQRSLTHALVDNFLGNSPYWYKLTIIFFLIANPMVLWSLGPAVAGWLLVGEFRRAVVISSGVQELGQIGAVGNQQLVDHGVDLFDVKYRRRVW